MYTYRWKRALVLLGAALLIGPLSLLFSQSTPEPAAAGEEALLPQTIPPELRRPVKGEHARYPIDTVIGPMGPGTAPEDAYRFAQECLQALVAGNRGAAVLAGIDEAALEENVAAIQAIKADTFRLGGGREEVDGAVSFMVRFLGREQGITAELYIRQEDSGEKLVKEIIAKEQETEPEEPAEDELAAADPVPKAPQKTGPWHFDDLLLEEARDRAMVEDKQRFDFSPYHRFF